MIVATMACGHRVQISGIDVPACPQCGEMRVARVKAPPPKFRGVVLGPCAEYVELPGRHEAFLSRPSAPEEPGMLAASNQAITEFLEAHQAVGVPLYVVFPSDGGEGEVLPTVLTQELVAKALARAKR